MVLYTKPPRIVEGSGDPFESVVAVPVGSVDGGLWTPDDIPSELRSMMEVLWRLGVFKGGSGSSYVVPYGSGVVLAGVGRPGDAEGVRRGFAQAARSIRESVERLGLYVDGLGSLAFEAVISAGLGVYRLEEFRSSRRIRLSELAVYGGRFDFSEASALLEGVYLARDIANAPPNHLTPSKLALEVEELFSRVDGVEVEVLGYDRLVREGFGGIVNVGKGSDEKPVLVIARYRGGGRRVALVGKTVIFDTGGINLKPSQGITYMRADKAGGAAVLGALWTAAKLKLPLDLYALIPAVVNVPSGSSYLPSDVIRMWDGTMVEVTNTDAEGRLIMADAIAYAAERLGAEVIIDVATLTGAIVVALGPLMAGLFSRDEELARIFEEASRETGEKLWRMPMEDEYAKPMSKAAQAGDIVNSWQRQGGAIFAALFLERFTHGRRHVHLDIAGPGMAYEASQVAPPYWPEGGLAPGYGVRLLVSALRRLAGAV